MHTAVLPAERRLTDSGDFAATSRGGRRAGGRLVVVHVRRAARPEGSVGRVGLVVSKQVGGAVVRNRVKRRLRHLLRDRLDLVPAGATVVVRAQPAAAGADSTELGRELSRCLERATAEEQR